MRLQCFQDKVQLAEQQTQRIALLSIRLAGLSDRPIFFDHQLILLVFSPSNECNSLEQIPQPIADTLRNRVQVHMFSQHFPLIS